MREVSYYPGCSLESSAADYAASIQGVASLLGIKLVELPDWNCCGASAGHSLDHRAALNLSARNLALAVLAPYPLVVPCALCFNRLRSAQAALRADPSQLTPEVAALGQMHQSVKVVELNSFLSEESMRQSIEGKALRSL
jgi:heterodisulfide reductase subunit B2